MPDINTRITDYSQTITQMVEKGLLDIWGRLGEYREFLVVIGGLVPRYITAPEGTPDYDVTTHCGTMDIDFGISLAVSDNEKYKDICEILLENGYRNRLNDRGHLQRHSFVKGEGANALIIDFLTPKYCQQRSDASEPVLRAAASYLDAERIGRCWRKVKISVFQDTAFLRL